MEGSRAKFGKAMMEFIGTAILLCTIQVSVGLGADMAPLAIGAVLITIVYAGGPISGAHYNPAVSLAVTLRGKMSPHEMSMYWISQILGGFLGAIVGGIINGGNYSVVTIGEGCGIVQAYVAEFVFTFLLCFVVLAVATSSKADNNHYYGAAIGLVVMAGAITVGPISGGAFNPAVALGLMLARFSNVMYAVEVSVVNLLGGAIAAACFYLVAPDEFKSKDATAGDTILETGSLIV